jgi:hypothetical protein
MPIFRGFFIAVLLIGGLKAFGWTDSDSLPERAVASICPQQIDFYSGLQIQWIGASDSCQMVDLPVAESELKRTRLFDLYPRIDLIVVERAQQHVTYEFVVQPGGDPGAIALQVSGARWVPWGQSWQSLDGQHRYRWSQLTWGAFLAAGRCGGPSALLFAEQGGRVDFQLGQAVSSEPIYLRWEQHLE